jgi:hypothetical protein
MHGESSVRRTSIDSLIVSAACVGDRYIGVLWVCAKQDRRILQPCWGHLTAAAQKQLAPAVIMAICEFLLAVSETSASSDDLARHRRLFVDVDWIVKYLSDSLAGAAPPGAEIAAAEQVAMGEGEPALGRASATEDSTTRDVAEPSLTLAPAFPSGWHLEAR